MKRTSILWVFLLICFAQVISAQPQTVRKLRIEVKTNYIKCLAVNDGIFGSRDGEEIYGSIRVSSGFCSIIDASGYQVRPRKVPSDPSNPFFLGWTWSRLRNNYISLKAGQTYVINNTNTFEYNLPLPAQCTTITDVIDGQDVYILSLASDLDEKDRGNDPDDKLNEVCPLGCSTSYTLRRALRGGQETVEQIHQSGGTKVVVNFTVKFSVIEPLPRD